MQVQGFTFLTISTNMTLSDTSKMESESYQTRIDDKRRQRRRVGHQNMDVFDLGSEKVSEAVVLLFCSPNWGRLWWLQEMIYGVKNKLSVARIVIN